MTRECLAENGVKDKTNQPKSKEAIVDMAPQVGTRPSSQQLEILGEATRVFRLPSSMLSCAQATSRELWGPKPPLPLLGTALQRAAKWLLALHTLIWVLFLVFNRDKANPGVYRARPT